MPSIDNFLESKIKANAICGELAESMIKEKDGKSFEEIKSEVKEKFAMLLGAKFPSFIPYLMKSLIYMNPISAIIGFESRDQKVRDYSEKDLKDILIKNSLADNEEHAFSILNRVENLMLGKKSFGRFDYFVLRRSANTQGRWNLWYVLDNGEYY